MEIAKQTQLTARAALLVSGLSLCLSTWAVGCQSETSEGSTEPTKVEDKTLPTRPTTAKPDLAKPDPTQNLKTPKSEAKDPKTQPTGKVEGAAGGSVRMKRLVVTTQVEQREPAPTTELTAGQGPIVAFVELGNESTEDQYVIVTFEHEDGIDAVGHIKLKVPARQPRWRTWGRTRMISDAGEWVAVVRTEDGRELGRQPFAVQPS
jgi:hypothetical protein